MGCTDTVSLVKHVMLGVLLGLFNLVSSLINIFYLYREDHLLFASLSLFLLWFPGKLSFKNIMSWYLLRVTFYFRNRHLHHVYSPLLKRRQKCWINEEEESDPLSSLSSPILPSSTDSFNNRIPSNQERKAPREGHHVKVLCWFP